MDIPVRPPDYDVVDPPDPLPTGIKDRTADETDQGDELPSQLPNGLASSAPTTVGRSSRIRTIGRTCHKDLLPPRERVAELENLRLRMRAGRAIFNPGSRADAPPVDAER